jgi:geranylgeranyl diphosphate synthase type II
MNAADEQPDESDRSNARTASAHHSEAVESKLDAYGQLVRRRMAELLEQGEPRRYLYEPLAVYPRRSSKSLRPSLCIASCLAFGGTLERVFNSAVALELLHNAFMIHDDVEDGSEYRRGGPTLHRQYGTGIAINAGDALNAIGMSQLIENRRLVGMDLTWQILCELNHLARQTVEGQAMELGWVSDNRCDLSEADYLRMILKKTCWYTAIHPCRIGALVALEDPQVLARFNRFGYYLGAAFQIQDDVLNLIGDEKVYGKEGAGDLFEGKRTLALIHLQANCTPGEKLRLVRFLAKPRVVRTRREAEWILRLMIRRGSIDCAAARARNLAGAALAEFAIAYGDAKEGEAKDLLHGIVRYMIERRL